MSEVSIMDGAAVSRAIKRISYEIVEKNKGVGDIVLVGIRRRGVPFAQRLADNILLHEGEKPKVGVVDITFYRDDLSMLDRHPVVNGTEIDFPIDGKKVVLCDDVLYTGRTVRAAIDALMDLGRAARIEFAVLVDRGHRELPFRADYVGKNVPTSREERIEVRLAEIDGDGDGVVIAADK